MAKSLAIGAIIGTSVGASVGKAFDTLDNRARKARDHLKKVRVGEKAAKDVI